MPETVVHFQIRMPPDLHEQLSSRARAETSSLNALIVSILRAAEDQAAADGSPVARATPAAG